MSTKRWTAYVGDDDGDDVFVCVSPDARGEWIRYSDHEAEVERYAKREQHYAKLLGVADGGQYRADWGSAIEKVLAEIEWLREQLRLANIDAFNTLAEGGDLKARIARFVQANDTGPTDDQTAEEWEIAWEIAMEGLRAAVSAETEDDDG